MIISGRFWRKTIVTAIAAIGFVSLYEVTALDSKYVARLATLHETIALPSPGSRLAFSATAYCKGLITASGVAVQSGVAAADPELLPVGSVIEIDSLPHKYNGIYTVMDTGPAVQGRQLDLYMWSCNEALQFGRKPIHLTVLRLGWNPRATTPGFLDRIFKRQSEQEVLPARPLPQAVPQPER
jgi:3D (Asp-Asp-Asp) domain-containing protein